MIDEKDNHEYFIHKYNISNKIKEKLIRLALDLVELKKDKDFFEKNLIKNVFINGKNHLITLNLINFSIYSKVKLKNFNRILNDILNTRVPKLHIDGEFLKQNGMTEGESLGKVLKEVEKEWINNNFKISNDRVKELINNYSN